MDREAQTHKKFSTNTKDMGNGFRDHGVATPISNHRGTVATVDGEGRNIVLVWLFDIRGANTLLVIDATSGETMEMDIPFPPGGDCPYASLLSSRNRYYTHYLVPNQLTEPTSDGTLTYPDLFSELNI